ncbi:ketopantoate reductase family protein [Clostridium sp. JNZ X4-2]
MKIAVIGAGAMGSLYGGYISKAFENVYLVDVWKEHIEAINKKGLNIDEEDKSIVIYPKAATNGEDIGYVDLIIVFVKSTSTEEALNKNSVLLGPDTIVLSLQNGYGNIAQIEKYVDADNIIAGTTSHGSTMLGPGHIKHAGIGKTYIGWAYKKEDKRINKIADILVRSGFDTIISNNIMESIWSKLIINAGINALTAILKVENGEILKYEETKQIIKMEVGEAVKIARASGVFLNEDDMYKRVIKVAGDTSKNKSSMLQDILNKKKTEIDNINGAIVKEGKKYSIDTPVNLVLTNLVKSIE